MKQRQWLYLLTLAGSVAGLPLIAAAQGPSGYLGGGAGYYRLDDSQFLDEDENFKDDRFAWQAMVGVHFNPIFSVEGGYMDFGSPSDGAAEMRLKGWQVSGLAHIPLTENFAPYGRIGQFFWDRERELPPAGLRRSDSGNDTFFGLGARFDLSEMTQLRVGYDRMKADDSDVDLVNLNLLFNF